MKALHALARGEDSARGDELVHYDSPTAMMNPSHGSPDGPETPVRKPQENSGKPRKE